MPTAAGSCCCCCLSRSESCPCASPLAPGLPSLCRSGCPGLPSLFPDSFLRSCRALSGPKLLFLAKGFSHVPAQISQDACFTASYTVANQSWP